MDTPWRIELLGKLCAQQGDLVLTRFRTQKTALLLARLALFPRRDHPREELADLFWPEATLEAGRNNLKQSLSTLRRLIEPPGIPAGSVLIATRMSVRLNPTAVTTDAAEFEQAVCAGLRAAGRPEGAALLRHALALYQGDLLPGFYDDWVLDEREVLAARIAEAQSALAKIGSSLAVSAATPKIAENQERPSAAPRPSLRLPMQFTRFFGRDLERAEISRRLQDPEVRLLTLTGPGGSGKTRLSLEAARQAAETFDSHVYFVPLADLTDPALIFGAVAEALHLPRSSQSEPLTLVIAALADTPALLVLDNLEQFATAAAPALATLLTRLPSLTILATSRQRLYVAGEAEVPVSPLPIPSDTHGNEPPPLEELSLFPGVQLFVDRARLARPDFQITVRNASAIADICRRLEGLPLALELAAAWAQVLTPAQMRDRLQERFSLLVSRTKDVPDRHLTLWAAIEWSCRLLPPPLAEFWRKLSIFRGGFTAEAAAEVCGEPLALDCLGQLLARSLVTVEAVGEENRFRLLEMLREFGESELTQEQSREVSQSHADFFLKLAEAAEPNLTGSDQAKWLQCLALEQDNLRFVLSGAAGASDENGLRLRLASALWRFWSIRGPLDEGRLFLERALKAAANSESTPAAAKALNGLAVLIRRQGDLDAAEEVQRRCLALWRVLAETKGVAAALNNLGTLLTLKGDFAAAEPMLQESLLLWRELGQAMSVAQTLNNLGFLAQEQGDPHTAKVLCTESLALFQTLNSAQGKTLSMTILAAGFVALKEYDSALPLCREILEIARELNDSQAVVTCLQLLAEIRIFGGSLEEAAQLLGSASRLRAQIGSFQDKRAQACVAALTETVRAALPKAVFESAWAAGQAQTFDDAVGAALKSISR